MKIHTLIIGIAFSLSVMTLHAEDNLCAECITELTDSVNIRKVGLGYSKSQAKAEELALQAARDSLLEVLRDSVGMICNEVEVKRDKSGEYLSIKFFSKDEEPTKYYFLGDSILTNVTVRCEECARDGKQEYKACCVLSAPREDFSRASNIVMFQILRMMSSFF